LTDLNGLLWRKRGTGLPPKYGPAHTADLRRPAAAIGFYAYCGTHVPTGNDRLWTTAADGDRRCRECVKGAQRDAENPPPRRHPDAPLPNVY